MTATPSDASSLLVPVHLDAWCVGSQSQPLTAMYKADYTRLTQFKALLDAPFQPSTEAKPAPGVRLHWALPDALTHGHTSADGRETIFPLVPNRWLVARFNAPAAGGWQCKLWVVESDYTGGQVGTTSADLTKAGVTSVPLSATRHAVAAGDELQIVSPHGTYAATVVAAAAAPLGATAVAIRPFDFSTIQPSGLVKGSTVSLLAGSAYLDPSAPSSMQVTNAGVATFQVNLSSVGKSHDIDSWQGSTDASGKLFLQAVGPGNVSFAAYMPTVSEVFSFTDSELPAEGTGVYTYTYMVVGWYSDPAQGDPLRGVTVWDPAVWATEAEWQAQTPAARMTTLLAHLRWSVDTGGGTNPPAPPPLSTSLYHGLVADVQWPPPTSQPYPGKIDSGNVHVAVGNTSTDALAALVKSEAHARAASDPAHKSAWVSAGDTLAELMQAAMYDLLDQYGKPGGAVLVRQQIEQAWFGSARGGTLWEVIGTSPQASDQAAAPPQLTPAQAAAVNAALGALNASQAASDESERSLWSLQAQLYQMWWKVGRANAYGLYGGWGSGPTTRPDWSTLMQFVLSLYPLLFEAAWKQYCAFAQAQSALPDPTPASPGDPRAPDLWANANAGWLFPDASGDPRKLRLQDLGLHLKGSARPHFWHPNDPVLMVSGLDRSQRHGEDGRYNDDGTLTCRLPGQTITGVKVPGQPAVNTQTVTRGGSVNLNPCGAYTSVPSIQTLLAEAFFVDPSNAPVVAKAVAGSDANTLKTAVAGLLAGAPAANTSWAGTPPAAFSVVAWEQGWAPLFLEWNVLYYPTGGDFQFSLADWQFDGEEYAWLGTGFDGDTQVGYSGRTLLTPQAPLTFKAKIEAYLKNNPPLTFKAQLDGLIQTVAGWDVLSQTLSGLTDQLVTLVSQETFPPPPGDDVTVSCPAGRGTPPGVAALVGDQYHSVPVVETTNDDAFFPVRAGFVEFQSLQIVDSFGQVYGGTTHAQGGQQSVWTNTGQGFQPTLGRGLVPSCAPTVPPAAAKAALGTLQYGSFQLPPRLVQPTRLDVNFLANDGSGKEISVSANPNPVCGWLLPNHLDGGIAVYDAAGRPLGELLALPPGEACDNWRPRPGDPGPNPPPTCPADIPNAALSAVVRSIAAQTTGIFEDLLMTIDETLWMVDPLGGREDQFLSVLVGRPLAVVQAEVRLSLQGEPVFSQFWDRMVADPSADPSEYKQLKDTGGVLDVSFPVRLGSLELRDDGLIGYFLPSSDNYATFYAVHHPDEVTAGDKYLRQIVNASPPSGSQPYQGNVFVKPDGDPVVVTMLVDPRGSVHAYTGVIPVVSASLPGQLVEEFIRDLLVTFRTGPVIADPGTLRIPQPAEQHGVWSWVQAVAPPSGGKGTVWAEESIVDADDRARMPDRQLQLREGWLQLSDLDEQAG
jgi:hypothetical protein